MVPSRSTGNGIDSPEDVDHDRTMRTCSDVRSLRRQLRKDNENDYIDQLESVKKHGGVNTAINRRRHLLGCCVQWKTLTGPSSGRRCGLSDTNGGSSRKNTQALSTRTLTNSTR